MKCTRYFSEQVPRKRPYLPVDQFAAIMVAPLRKIVQSDERVRYWGTVTDIRDGRERVLRIVTLDDGETVHNAFHDRGYRETLP